MSITDRVTIDIDDTITRDDLDAWLFGLPHSAEIRPTVDQTAEYVKVSLVATWVVAEV